MARDAIIATIQNSWPMFIIVFVILITLRLTDTIINKKPLILYQEFINIGFITYVLCLFYVVSFDDVDWSTSNFQPLHEIMRYEVGSRLFFKNVMSNMLMFIPYGFFVSYYLSSKSIKPIILLTIITSATIEVTQLVIGRVFDVDDILLNILGGIAGYLIYRVLILIKNILPSFLKKNWFFNFLSIILVVILGLYIFNIFNLGGLLW